jgi:SAM-dependent methyltransferase
MIDRCPGCGSHRRTVFYELSGLPVHSVLLVPTQAQARSFPQGDLRLAFCQDCGFISNAAFQPEKLAYSSAYEETQGFSPTFNAFHLRLANHLIDRYDLRNKTVVEIGCGKGEFLTLLCELGGNRGIGFDPAYVPGRAPSQAADRLTFITDFYSEKYAASRFPQFKGDFYCCKMTLEHIQEPLEFVTTLRKSLGDQQEAVIFFQVPDVMRILEERAFWDIYYEHCSYFSPGSLASLFRRAGFEVTDLWKDYDDQYLMIEARPGQVAGGSEGLPDSTPQLSRLPLENDLSSLESLVQAFAVQVPAHLARWKSRLAAFKETGRRVVLWGAGSKGVAFLTTLKAGDEIAWAVDINPHKQGAFMPGSGHPIVLPEQMQAFRPDTVIVMNPIYCAEIRKDLKKLGLAPELISINA